MIDEIIIPLKPQKDRNLSVTVSYNSTSVTSRKVNFCQYPRHILGETIEG